MMIILKRKMAAIIFIVYFFKPAPNKKPGKIFNLTGLAH